MLALQAEHSAPFSPQLARLVERAEGWATTPGPDGAVPIEREDVRRRLVEAAVDLEVAELLEARTTWMEDRGAVPVAEGPMSKLYSTEAGVRHAESLTAMVGTDAPRSRTRSAERRGGKEWGSRCRSGRSPSHIQKKS